MEYGRAGAAESVVIECDIQCLCSAGVRGVVRGESGRRVAGREKGGKGNLGQAITWLGRHRKNSAVTFSQLGKICCACGTKSGSSRAMPVPSVQDRSTRGEFIIVVREDEEGEERIDDK